MRITLLFFVLNWLRKHRNHSKSVKRPSCLDLLSCLELALKSLGSKLPYIAALKQFFLGMLYNTHDTKDIHKISLRYGLNHIAFMAALCKFAFTSSPRLLQKPSFTNIIR